jgi:imidazolonepropionase-like amidohydrolase
VQVLVGGTIEAGPVIDHPVIVIEKGEITAVGPQTHLPIPRGSAKTDTSAYRIRHASGGAVSPGMAADLDLVAESGEVVRRMRAGVWQ